MNPDEVTRTFEEAQKIVAHLQSGYAQAAQSLGQVASVLYATKPYWVQLAGESGSNATILPILESGRATIAEISHSLATIKPEQQAPLNQLQSVSLTASFFGSNTAATSSLVPLNGNTEFRVEAIPVPEFSAEKTLADRFGKIDPALGKVCAEIWESLYGTRADPERSALFMIRQTWDHLFDRLAPDSEVRETHFWTKKNGPKPEMVTREERFKFAVDRHVKDPQKAALLLAACKQMLDLYQELNRAHERGEIDKLKALRSLNTMYSWLIEWADALGI
jgi:hypothetical protein